MQYCFFLLCFTLLSCSRLAVEDTIDRDFSLVNHRGERKEFPGNYSGKILLAGYVYTHCPDVCPMTVQNMQRVAEKFPKEKKLSFLAISFDPDRDSVAAMRNFAEAYGLGADPRWDFLTGRRQNIDPLMSRLGIMTERSYTQSGEAKQPVYFLNHTDRITLIDAKGNVRHRYSGSKADIHEIARDLQQLLNE